MRVFLFLGCLALFAFSSAGAIANSKPASLDAALANKALVVDFYQQVLFERNADAIDQFIGDTYIQHNPNLPDGKAALKALIKALPKPDKAVGKIVRAIAEGDLVVLHVNYYGWPGPQGGAVVDIFRVADHKIVEHWDVVQAVPAQSANDNTMF
ncbi:nuclear transport factor 2 family protein [Simiduia aestuariiviva]|uniref:Putative SnoaL-like aldol condensation-catalyzing enzyme n=1 Tax=Simiduia aestuariiviva TaxID=1510459 RepID=A0A839UPG7_9GAMM|nr:nuclear transport factor 2 family protein [Simiduia aestuariiviva]MBB3169663.1 putative SnoaL-like aldol condensation-catalyzing enzyme [Simiduia aestuariiviva]